jgi:hypothetical protein
MSNGASRAPQEIRMDFAVLPAASLYFLYCRHGEAGSGFFFGQLLKHQIDRIFEFLVILAAPPSR